MRTMRDEPTARLEAIDEPYRPLLPIRWQRVGRLDEDLPDSEGDLDDMEFVDARGVVVMEDEIERLLGELHTCRQILGPEVAKYPAGTHETPPRGGSSSPSGSSPWPERDARGF